MADPKIEAVIFDMDGVITDTEALHMEAERRVCAEAGIDAPIEMWAGFKGRTTLEIFETIVAACCPGQRDPRDLARRKVELYVVEAPRRMEVFPGAVDFVRACAARYRTALATSSSAAIQRAAFARFGLAPHFEVVTTGDEVENGKPHPEPYLLSCERLALAPEACAVIEDSDNGIRSAAAAGCLPLGITNSFPAGALRAAGAAFVGESYAELAERLGL